MLASAVDPELYAELLDFRYIAGPRKSESPSAKNDVETSRLVSLLESIACLVICRPGQEAAVALETGKNCSEARKVKTTIYITYNQDPPPNEQNAIISHIRKLFFTLKRMPLPPDEKNSPPVSSLPSDTSSVINSMLNAIYAFSIHIPHSCIAHRREDLNKAINSLFKDKDKLSESFTKKEQDEIADILAALACVAAGVKTDNISASSDVLQCLYKSYKDWIKAGYMSLRRKADELTDMDDDEADGDEVENEEAEEAEQPDNFFQRIQRFMYEVFRIHLPLERWVRKLVSLHICCLRLAHLRLSHRLGALMDGSIDVKILSALPPSYSDLQIDLSDNVITDIVLGVQEEFKDRRINLNTTLGQHTNLAKSFVGSISQWLDKHKQPRRDPVNNRAHYSSPYVHCEISLAYHIRQDKLAVLDHIGVSKLSCALCQLYLRIYSRIYQPLRTQGSHRKFYPGWVFPVWDVDHDTEIRQELVSELRVKLADMLASFITKELDSRLSKSTDASDSSANDWNHLRNEGVSDYVWKRFAEGKSSQYFPGREI